MKRCLTQRAAKAYAGSGKGRCRQQHRPSQQPAFFDAPACIFGRGERHGKSPYFVKRRLFRVAVSSIALSWPVRAAKGANCAALCIIGICGCFLET